MSDNTSLVRKTLETSLQLGDLSDLAKASEVVMLLIDTSGSMVANVRKSGKRRIDALRTVVEQLQSRGHVPMIAFGGPYDAQVRFVDRVPEPDGGTPLAIAIPFAKQYGANRLVVVSDGMPDDPNGSLDAARQFDGRIDVVFIGDPGDGGDDFLDRLAKLTGGTRLQGDLSETGKLAGAIIGLLEGDVAPKRAPIQGNGFTADEDAGDEPDTDDDDDDTDEDDEDDE